jgi:hypothetical protein
MWLYLILQVISQLYAPTNIEVVGSILLELPLISYLSDMMMTTFWTQQPKKGKTQQKENMKEYRQLCNFFNFSNSSKYMSEFSLTEKADTAQKDQPRDILHCGFSD